MKIVIENPPAKTPVPEMELSRLYIDMMGRVVIRISTNELVSIDPDASRPITVKAVSTMEPDVYEAPEGFSLEVSN